MEKIISALTILTIGYFIGYSINAILVKITKRKLNKKYGTMYRHGFDLYSVLKENDSE